jgi:DNA-binding Lrp family transcriptional regulator
LASYTNSNLQLKILLEMTNRNWDQRFSYAGLGKKLGVDEEAIRLRVKKIADSGLIEGWQLIINPHMIGLELASVLVEVDEATRIKDEVISQLKLLDRVVFIFNFFDRGLRVAFYYEDEQELQRKTDLIRLMCGSKSFLILRHISPPFHMKLRRTDWQILKSLRQDPKKNSSVIARELKLSTRTITRRLTVLLENNTFYVLPIGNLKKSKDLAYHLFVSFADKERKQSANGLFLEMIPQIVYFDSNLQDFTNFCVLCESVSEAEQIIQMTKEVDGVKSLTSRILKEILPTLGWFDNEIEKKITAL